MRRCSAGIKLRVFGINVPLCGVMFFFTSPLALGSALAVLLPTEPSACTPPLSQRAQCRIPLRRRLAPSPAPAWGSRARVHVSAVQWLVSHGNTTSFTDNFQVSTRVLRRVLRVRRGALQPFACRHGSKPFRRRSRASCSSSRLCSRFSSSTRRSSRSST